MYFLYFVSNEASKLRNTEYLSPQKFVHQSGGHRGGWDEYDHGTFIKFRNMYKVS